MTEIAGCIKYMGSTCTQCQAGLVLSNGICSPKYCQNYNPANPTSCVQCYPRFYKLASGLCYPRNCITFNSSDWSCLEC